MAESQPAFQLEQVPCDLCGSSASTSYMKPAWYLPISTPEIEAVQCSSCNLVYLNPRPTQQCITRLYKTYYETGRQQKESTTLQKGFRKNLLLRAIWHWYCGQYLTEVLKKAHGAVLDIGCGTGDFLEDLALRGCDAHGIEINPDSVRVCREKGLDVRCEDFDTLSFPEQSFDTIIMWHAIEHLPSPKRALEKIRRMLRPGGRLFLYCPNVDSYCMRWFKEYWYAWHMPFHFYHFSPATLKTMVESAGFSVMKMAAVTPEYPIKYSLDFYMRSKGGFLYALILKTGILRSQFFRLGIAPILRLLDLCMPGKGEYLQVELLKEARNTSIA